MITAQDVLSGYGQKIRKATTSILPYLREQEKQKNESGKEQERKKTDAGVKKSENDLQDNHTWVSKINQYDKERLDILRGDV